MLIDDASLAFDLSVSLCSPHSLAGTQERIKTIKKKTKIEKTEEKRHLQGQSTQTSKRNDYSLTKGSHF